MSVSGSIESALNVVFKPIGAMFSDVDAADKIAAIAHRAIELSGTKIAELVKVMNSLESGRDWGCVIDLTEPISGFATGGFRGQGFLNSIIACASFGVSLGVSGSILKAVNDKVNLFNSAQIGTSFSRVPVLGGLTFTSFTCGAAAIAYGGAAIKAGRDLYHVGDRQSRIYALLKLVSSVAGVAAQIFAFTGFGSAWPLSLGIASAFFGLAAFFQGYNRNMAIARATDRQEADNFRQGSLFIRGATILGALSTDDDCRQKVNKTVIGVHKLAIEKLSGKGKEFLKVLNNDYLKAFDEFYKFKTFFTIFPDFVDGDKRRGVLKTVPKGISKVAGCFASFMETVSVIDEKCFVNRLGSGYFAQKAWCIGKNLSWFDIVKNILGLVSVLFSMVETSRYFYFELYRGKKGSATAQDKLRFWNDFDGNIDVLGEKYDGRCLRLNNILSALPSTSSDRESLEVKRQKCDKVLWFIREQKWENIEELKQKKILRYRRRLENICIKRRMAVVSLIADVCKVVSIIFVGFVTPSCGVLSNSVRPLQYFTSDVGHAVLGTITSAVGLTKSVYKKNNCLAEEPEIDLSLTA